MQLFLVEPTTVEYNAAINACAEGAEAKKARQIFHKMEATRVDTDVITYNSVIRACGMGGLLKEALDFFSSMDRVRVAPDDFTRNAIINACEKSGQWRLVLEMLQDFQGHKVELHVFSHNIAISTFAKGMRWPRALGVLWNMDNNAEPIDEFTHTASLQACAVGKQWLLATKLLSEAYVTRVALNRYMCSAAVSACSQVDKWETVSCLLSSAYITGVVVYDDVICGAALRAFSLSGQWQLALSLFEAMPSMRIEQDFTSYSLVLEALYESGHEWQLLERALACGIYEGCLAVGDRFLDLHGCSEGVAVMIVRWWLAYYIHLTPEGVGPRWVRIITGWGKSRSARQTGDLELSVKSELEIMRLPSRQRIPGAIDVLVSHVRTLYRLELDEDVLDAEALVQHLMNGASQGQIIS